MGIIKSLVHAVLAGMMIGIGGTVYIVSENKTVGAFLFSIGLIVICELKFLLFTGKSGYILTSSLSLAEKIKKLCVIWVGNYIGVVVYMFMAKAAHLSLSEPIRPLLQAKLSQNVVETLLLSTLCGLLMFIAVDIYRQNEGFTKFMGILFCVPTFILCGFEHSIADMFYLSLAKELTFFILVKMIFFILTVTAGNILGGLIIPLTRKMKGNLKERSIE